MSLTIDRVENVTNNEIRDYIRNSKPVIITGEVLKWPAYKLWTFDFFRENYGDDLVSVTDGRFRQLAQMVGQRWKALDEEKRAYYQGLAKEDMARQKKAMEEYYLKQSEKSKGEDGGKGAGAETSVKGEA